MCWIRKLDYFKNFYPLKRGTFCQKCIFGAFRTFLVWTWAKLAAIYSKRHLQHDSMPFFPIASGSMTFFLGHVQKPATLGIFGLFYFFSPFLFSPFLIFLLQWLAFYWACFQFKNSREITIETENSYHGVAKCSWGKLCSEFFAQTSEHFRAYFWINGLETSDLLSLERSFPPAEFEYCISDANFGQTRWRQ